MGTPCRDRAGTQERKRYEKDGDLVKSSMIEESMGDSETPLFKIQTQKQEEENVRNEGVRSCYGLNTQKLNLDQASSPSGGSMQGEERRRRDHPRSPRNGPGKNLDRAPTRAITPHPEKGEVSGTRTGDKRRDQKETHARRSRDQDEFTGSEDSQKSKKKSKIARDSPVTSTAGRRKPRVVSGPK